jgi:hypothetical protein
MAVKLKRKLGELFLLVNAPKGELATTDHGAIAV